MEEGGLAVSKQHIQLLLTLTYPVTVGKWLYILLSDASIGKWRQHDSCPSFMSRGYKDDSDNINETFEIQMEKMFFELQ